MTCQNHCMYALHASSWLSVLYWLYSQCFSMIARRLNCAYRWWWNGVLHCGQCGWKQKHMCFEVGWHACVCLMFIIS
jgi:hypothetical protein